MSTSFVAPILALIPVQLLAYHTAVFMGTDVDQPRNLAKIGDGRVGRVSRKTSRSAERHVVIESLVG